jgi:hypothetical protein
LGPFLSIFGLLFGPKGLKIDFPNWMVSFFSALRPIQGHKVRHLLLVAWGQISTFAPMGMLDLG